jgi:hypothetical protein
MGSTLRYVRIALAKSVVPFLGFAGGCGMSNDGGACQYPATANSFDDASAVGCAPHAFDICAVPNGGTVGSDGSVTASDGTLVNDACHSACDSNQYALACTGNRAIDTFAPEPDPSLGCTVIPIPGNTPWAVRYCCPCAR